MANNYNEPMLSAIIYVYHIYFTILLINGYSWKSYY